MEYQIGCAVEVHQANGAMVRLGQVPGAGNVDPSDLGGGGLEVEKIMATGPAEY